MKITEAQLLLVKKIIEQKHRKLLVSVLGKDQFTAEELASFKKQGIDVQNKASLLELIYTAHGVATRTESLINTEALLRLGIEKLMNDTLNRVELILRNSRPMIPASEIGDLTMEKLQKESSIAKVKQLLKDASKVGERDWQRVALTEMSNAVGFASVDKILKDQKTGIDPEDIYVYRVPVKDSVTCKWCRKFYGDEGEIPKIYRLSTLIGNGSNYGKLKEDWKPVVGATHPNTRTGSIIEVKRGYAVRPSGALYFIGNDKWDAWIKEHLEA